MACSTSWETMFSKGYFIERKNSLVGHRLYEGIRGL